MRMRNKRSAGVGRVTAIIGMTFFMLGCGLSTASSLTETSDSQNPTPTANLGGTTEAAIEVIKHEVDRWMMLIEYSDELMPGMQSGIPEPGSYLAEDFDLSTELPVKTQEVIRYLEESIRDALWHANFPMWGLDVWESPGSERPVQVRRTPNDTLLVTVRLPDDKHLGVVFAFLRDLEVALPFHIYAWRYGISSKLDWDLFARTFASFTPLAKASRDFPVSCGAMAKSQGYGAPHGYCYREVWDAGNPSACMLAPEEQWVCEAAASPWWHDQWRNLGPSFEPDEDSLVLECDTCLVYNDHIPDEAFWKWQASESASTEITHNVIKLRLGGVLTTTGRFTPGRAEAQLCHTATESPKSLGDIDCGPVLRGCVAQVAERKVIRVQSQGWPELNCEALPSKASTPEPFVDEGVTCTDQDCVRIELTELAYDRMQGHMQYANASAPDAFEGVVEVAAQRWGTKRTLRAGWF